MTQPEFFDIGFHSPSHSEWNRIFENLKSDEHLTILPSETLVFKYQWYIPMLKTHLPATDYKHAQFTEKILDVRGPSCCDIYIENKCPLSCRFLNKRTFLAVFIWFEATHDRVELRTRNHAGLLLINQHTGQRCYLDFKRIPEAFKAVRWFVETHLPPGKPLQHLYGYNTERGQYELSHRRTSPLLALRALAFLSTSIKYDFFHGDLTQLDRYRQFPGFTKMYNTAWIYFPDHVKVRTCPSYSRRASSGTQEETNEYLLDLFPMSSVVPLSQQPTVEELPLKEPTSSKTRGEDNWFQRNTTKIIEPVVLHKLEAKRKGLLWQRVFKREAVNTAEKEMGVAQLNVQVKSTSLMEAERDLLMLKFLQHGNPKQLADRHYWSVNEANHWMSLDDIVLMDALPAHMVGGKDADSLNAGIKDLSQLKKIAKKKKQAFEQKKKELDDVQKEIRDLDNKLDEGFID